MVLPRCITLHYINEQRYSSQGMKTVVTTEAISKWERQIEGRKSENRVWRRTLGFFNLEMAFRWILWESGEMGTFEKWGHGLPGSRGFTAILHESTRADRDRHSICSDKTTHFLTSIGDVGSSRTNERNTAVCDCDDIAWYASVLTVYRVGQKKLHTVFVVITLSTLNIFHNFWHTYSMGNLQVDGA